MSRHPLITRRRLKWEIFWHVTQPVKCRLGRHHRYDVMEDDASIQRSFCMRCMKDFPAKHPQPPDPVEAALMANLNEWLDDFLSREEEGAQLLQVEEGCDGKCARFECICPTDDEETS